MTESKQSTAHQLTNYGSYFSTPETILATYILILFSEGKEMQHGISYLKLTEVISSTYIAPNFLLATQVELTIPANASSNHYYFRVSLNIVIQQVFPYPVTVQILEANFALTKCTKALERTLNPGLTSVFMN